jgi:hypothetical protein
MRDPSVHASGRGMEDGGGSPREGVSFVIPQPWVLGRAAGRECRAPDLLSNTGRNGPPLGGRAGGREAGGLWRVQHSATSCNRFLLLGTPGGTERPVANGLACVSLRGTGSILWAPRAIACSATCLATIPWRRRGRREAGGRGRRLPGTRWRPRWQKRLGYGSVHITLTLPAPVRSPRLPPAAARASPVTRPKGPAGKTRQIHRSGSCTPGVHIASSCTADPRSRNCPATRCGPLGLRPEQVNRLWGSCRTREAAL